MTEAIVKLAEEAEGAEAVYVKVSFYDNYLRNVLSVYNDLMARLVIEVTTKRTIRGTPVFIVADRRHPPYKIIKKG